MLLFVDTCHAAGITGAKAILRDPLYELTSDEYGTIVFSSSLSREISREDEKWQHGAFTKAILDTFAASDSRYAAQVPQGRQRPRLPRAPYSWSLSTLASHWSVVGPRGRS